MCQSWDYANGLTTASCGWISLDCFVSDLVYVISVTYQHQLVEIIMYSDSVYFQL